MAPTRRKQLGQACSTNDFEEMQVILVTIKQVHKHSRQDAVRYLRYVIEEIDGHEH